MQLKCGLKLLFFQNFPPQISVFLPNFLQKFHLLIKAVVSLTNLQSDKPAGSCVTDRCGQKTWNSITEQIHRL